MSRWYKRCGGDFIHGTMSLSLEEKGAYSLCLDLIYDRGGPIPDDPRWLSGICGVSMRKWNSLRDSLICAGKLIAEGGFLTNDRATLEIASADFYRRNQAEAGAKGGRKRAENAAAPKENSDLAQASLKPKEEIREEKKEVMPDKSGDYAFNGQTIKLSLRHLNDWRGTFHTIADIVAELSTIDEWWQSQASAKRENWFLATKGMLNKKHQTNMASKNAEASASVWDGMP